MSEEYRSIPLKKEDEQRFFDLKRKLEKKENKIYSIVDFMTVLITKIEKGGF